MACRKYFKLIIKILVSAFVIIICAYQVYVVGLLYYSYPTTVDYRIGASLNVPLPAITICSDIAATILIDKIIKLEPNLFHTFAGKTKQELAEMMRKKSYRDLLEAPLQRLPINVQHHYTISADQFFGVCELATPIGYQKIINYKTASGNYLSRNRKINCSEVAAVLPTISFEKKCFTLFHNKHENYRSKNYQIPRDSASKLKYLTWIRISRDYIYNGLIYVHSPQELHQNSDGNNVIQISPNRDQFVSVSFARTTTSLLPPPYATQCKNFTLDGFTSREHCVQECKVEMYLKEDGWPGDVFANSSVSSPFSKVWINSKSPSGHLEGGLALDDTCSERCGNYEDCLNVYYDVKVLRVVERVEDDDQERDWFTIGVLPPKSMDVHCVHIPKLEPVELAVYVGGLVSMYLGVSVVSVFVTCFALITLYYGRPTHFLRSKNGSKSEAGGSGGKSPNQSYGDRLNRDYDYRYREPQQFDYEGNQYRPQYRPPARLPGILQFMFES